MSKNVGYQETWNLIMTASRIAIVSHIGPDGDTTGSGLALAEALRQKGKTVHLLVDDVIPPTYRFMPGADGYHQVAEGETIPTDLTVVVDASSKDRMGANEAALSSPILNIDHHISNTDYAEKTLVCPDASATCEVVFELMEMLGVPLTEDITKCIYTGIATDTGCFKYENTTARCHEIVAELKRTFDIGYAKINREMFEVKSRGRIKIERAVTDIMEYYLDDRCTMICVTTEILDKWGVDSSELEGLAGIPLQVEGVEVGVTIKQRDENSYKISMRSANEVNVSDICASLGGGGHVKAAGCLLYGTIDEVKRKIVDAVAEGIKKCS